MVILGIIISSIGIILVMIAGLFLLPKIFISNEELEMLAELPFEESTTNTKGIQSQKILPIAVTDAKKIEEYKERYINARKEEREKGKLGLYFLVLGSMMQAAGLILTSIEAI